jgi:hypothetical protein
VGLSTLITGAAAATATQRANTKADKIHNRFIRILPALERIDPASRILIPGSRQSRASA